MNAAPVSEQKPLLVTLGRHDSHDCGVASAVEPVGSEAAEVSRGGQARFALGAYLEATGERIEMTRTTPWPNR